MGEEEIGDRIELELTSSLCGGCSGMGGVRRDSSGAIDGIVCKGHKGECVSVKGDTCTKHIQLCPRKAQIYLPVLARHTRVQMAA